MKVSVDMQILKRAVSEIKPAMGQAKNDLTVLLTFFEVKDNRVHLFVTDKEMFACTHFEALTSEGEGNFSMLSAKLLKLVSEVDIETLSFDVDVENICVEAGYLTVNFDNFDSKMMNLRDQLLSDCTTQSEDVERLAFLNALMCNKTCIPQNDLRPDMGHVEIRGGRILSSDGSKVMVTECESLFSDTFSLKIPSTSVVGVVEVLKAADQATAII